MTPEHLTNEELANWMVPFTSIDDGKTVYAEKVVAEAARRLRNSIPKPVVEVVDVGDGDSEVRVNGTMIILCDSRIAMGRGEILTDALGLEGGGDEENVS